MVVQTKIDDPVLARRKGNKRSIERWIVTNRKATVDKRYELFPEFSVRGLLACPEFRFKTRQVFCIGRNAFRMTRLNSPVPRAEHSGSIWNRAYRSDLNDLV